MFNDTTMSEIRYRGKLSTYYGHGDYDNRRAHVYALAHNNYAAQAWDGTTSFRLGEFESEQEAENVAEDYVRGVV